MPVAESTDFKLPWKTVKIGRRRLTVGMSCCLGPGDRVVFRPGGRVLAKCVNGEAIVLPPYRAPERIRCGSQLIRVTIKEITNEAEYEGYKQLVDFHYRTRGSRGRHAILVATSRDPLLPRVLGYLELTTSFYMNKARSALFNAKFDSGDSIAWDGWNATVARKRINAVVRIARCVVYPEFRGLGLGQILVNHACRFSRRHWHVGGVRPYFIEITADMLKFIPFAARAGMVFIGNTEGNLARVQKDLDYLLRNAKRIKKGEIIRVKREGRLEDPQGILDLQLGYMRYVGKMLGRNGMSREELLRRLDGVDRRASLKMLDEFRDVLRFPKPTYMRGLTARAHRFLVERRAALGLEEPSEPIRVRRRMVDGPISVDSLTVTFRSSVRRTRRTHAVQQAFGISPSALECTVLKNVSLEVPPGSIVLCIGASGSGKSVLLDLIARRGRPRTGMRLEGRITIPSKARVGVLRALRSDRPLVELYGSGDVGRALHVLNVAGLSEAYVYLKRFRDLSGGQQYRAMIAKLIDSEANLWVADEFCSALDPVTANIVATSVRKHARRVGATVVLAAAHFGSFVHSLGPDIVVQLTNAWEYRVERGSLFLRRLPFSAVSTR